MPAMDSPVRGLSFRNGPFGKARCEIGWNWRPKPLSDFDLWYVVSGKGEMQLHNKVYDLSKGTCMLVRPGDQPRAEQKADDRLTVIFIHFRIENREEGPPADDRLLPPRYTQIEDTYDFEELLNRTLQVLNRQELYREEEFDCLMKQLFFRLYRAHAEEKHRATVTPRQRRIVSRVSELIREEGGRRIPHERLAAQVGLSPQYLSILFKKCQGISMKEYITQVRLERAMHLLTETSMNVSQVAAALGYSNIFLFSKQFKQKFGEPPSKFLMKALPPKPHGK